MRRLVCSRSRERRYVKRKGRSAEQYQVWEWQKTRLGAEGREKIREKGSETITKRLQAIGEKEVE